RARRGARTHGRPLLGKIGETGMAPAGQWLSRARAIRADDPSPGLSRRADGARAREERGCPCADRADGIALYIVAAVRGAAGRPARTRQRAAARVPRGAWRRTLSRGGGAAASRREPDRRRSGIAGDRPDREGAAGAAGICPQTPDRDQGRRVAPLLRFDRHPVAPSTLPARSTGFAATSTKAMTQGSVPGLVQLWLVPRCTSTSPARRCTLAPSISITISPDITMAQSTDSVRWLRGATPG